MAEKITITAEGGKLNRLKASNELKKPDPRWNLSRTQMRDGCRLKEIFSSLIFYLAILVFLIGFNFSDTMVGNWYQQFMPTPTYGSIRDIFFVDSLLGFAVSDSSILKTTNGGDNWAIKLNPSLYIFKRIQFLNKDTGFACAGNNKLLRTFNSGEDWTTLTPLSIYPYDMSVLNLDIIWLADPNSFAGGVFFTSDGGVSWIQQFSGGTQNPNKIYMYNARIGFMTNSSASPNIYETTNGGDNWTVKVTGESFIDMCFVDSLTGWRTRGDTLKFTSNGGSNWSIQSMPRGGMIFSNNLLRFSVLNRDTIWGCGGYILYPNNHVKSILWRTTNGGLNWLFQIPDTSLLSFESFIKFTDRLHGWAYSINQTGIHTTTGGNDTFYTGLQQISNSMPKQFKLYQNYPNPFNPKTIIKYQIANSNPPQTEQISNVKLIVYDITGKEIITLVNERQGYGTYEVDFSGNGLSSGVYFYKIIIATEKEVFTETKKMILIK